MPDCCMYYVGNGGGLLFIHVFCTIFGDEILSIFFTHYFGLNSLLFTKVELKQILYVSYFHIP